MSVWQYVVRYLAMFSIQDAIDIALVTFLVYKIIKLINKSNAGQVVKGIILLILAMQLAHLLQLRVISYLFVNTMQLGLLALVIVFQPELRKALQRVGRSRFPQFIDREETGRALEKAIVQVVDACNAMSWARDGALIVFQRSIRLDDIVKTGTVLDGEPSSEFIKNIFYPKAPLHDGAVIIQEGRISSAGCVLPLSENSNLSKELGTRHRAGVGMSESSDAVVVIVSEETGSISVAIGGMLKRHLAPETLEKLLRNELLPKTDESKKTGFFNFWKVKEQ